MEDYAPELFDFLVENYELERVFSYDKWGYMLGGLRRTPEPPEGRALLADGAGELAVAIESPSEPPRPVAPGERAEIVSAQPWPFRPTLALRPTARRRTHRRDASARRAAPARGCARRWA